MKIIKMDVNNWAYDILLSSSDYGSWPRQHAICIKWLYNEKNVSVEISDQTLWSEVVSPNGSYFIMIFKDFTNCNCVIYNRNGEINRIICPPLLINRESISNHHGQNDIIGEIVGIDNPYGKYTHLAGDNLMIVKIADPKRMHRGKWTEHRILNPETGEIGELLFTDVSEEL